MHSICPLNKKKIINDPVYGFISIPTELIFDLIEHPYFQRLRYIKQLGMTHLVYPGALHTRFHHALGAMHLMGLPNVDVEAVPGKIHDVASLLLAQGRFMAVLRQFLDLPVGPNNSGPAD